MNHDAPRRPELWGGVECSLVRVGDAYHDQFIVGGHRERADDDLEKVAGLGFRTLRYPVSWERVCPDGDLSRADWAWTDARIAKLRDLGIRVIATLVHHGSGPRNTSLVDPEFPEKLAEFARAAAERYPWVLDWTPVNEPLTTARFAGLYGHWYPHGTDEATFTRCLLTEVRATVLAMRAIREVSPESRLIQTEDLGKTYSTPRLRYQAEFENDRRWVSFDLLCGEVKPAGLGARMWHHLQWAGISAEELAWYADNPCPPDVFGINHYITSERFLDERVQRYPAHTHGSNGRDHYADVEAVRALQGGCAGAGTLLLEAWDRYRRPVAITEAHLGCTSEEQMRWLAEVYREATWAREEGGADIQGVTVWSLFGATDWDSLLTKHRGSYEPGVWDTRGRPEPRPTGLVHVCRSLAAGEEPDHPVLVSLGWWDRDDCRLLYPPVEAELIAEAFAERRCPAIEPGSARDARPVLITGAAGRLGSALVRACTARGLAFVALDGRSELDIADGDAVARAIDEHRPWAVVNAAGYAGTGAAEADTYGCLRSNAKGPAVLTRECARRGVPLVLFSSALVFDGVKAPEPYVESDAPAATPSGVYARSKVQMEALTRREMAAGAAPGARLLIVRTASLFGASEGHEGGGDFLTRALASLASGAPVLAACDETLTPAYLPDVAHRTLDLLIDGEDGVWHLAHSGAATRAEIVRRAAELAGIDARGLRAAPRADIEQDKPRRSPWAVLGSERTATPLLCPLEDALRRFVADSEAVRAWACLSAERRGEFARRLIDGEPLVRK